MESWTCPECARRFARVHQRHRCGTGDCADVLRDRPLELRALYSALETVARSFGEIEIVARERYVLFRTTRVFADASITRDALRLALHLGRIADDARFFKIVADARQVTHVCMLRDCVDVDAIAAYLREAHAHSLAR